MADIHSDVTDLPQSCKAAADRAASFLAEEDRYAELCDNCRQMITDLEQEIAKKSGEKVALVAYRI